MELGLLGYEICQHLKASEQTRNIPVIFIIALDEVLDKVKAFAVGAVDYITKTFSEKDVFARVENNLTIRRLQKQLTEQNALLQQEIRDRQRSEAKFRNFFLELPSWHFLHKQNSALLRFKTMLV